MLAFFFKLEFAFHEIDIKNTAQVIEAIKNDQLENKSEKVSKESDPKIKGQLEQVSPDQVGELFQESEFRNNKPEQESKEKKIEQEETVEIGLLAAGNGGIWVIIVQDVYCKNGLQDDQEEKYQPGYHREGCMFERIKQGPQQHKS